MNASAFQAITDDHLIAAIDSARERVVVIAPGIWTLVADAISRAWARLPGDAVTVILDVSADVCRMGYGHVDALKTLLAAATRAGQAIGQESGIRLCVVLCDQQTFVFSPTPRQLEASPGSPVLDGASHAKVNGLVLTQAPAGLEADLGVGQDGIATRTLGIPPLSQPKLEKIANDLTVNPPKNFDLSQAVSVYNAKIQFVEFTVTGCRLSEQRARLPKHLLHVLKNNPKLAGKIDNSIRLLDENDTLLKNPKLSQETVEQKRAEVAQTYLINVLRVGTVIERSRKPAFLADVEALRTQVTAFGKVVEKALADQFSATAKELAAELLPEVLKDIPKAWQKRLPLSPDPEQVRWRIVDDLIDAFGNPADKVRRMTVETIFKDVTYDMLLSPEFRKQLAPHFPDLPLMEEYTAAKERQSDETSLFS